jgi:hypothetical protein
LGNRKQLLQQPVFRRAAPAASGPAFPLLIRIADPAEHIRICRQTPSRDAPTTGESPAWLVHFLKTKSREFNWDLDADFFERKLGDGSAILLLDGRDEAPRAAERESTVRLFEHATQAYEQCRFVLTTRPRAYTGRSLLEGFQAAEIEPLRAEAIQKLLEHWCRGLFLENTRVAEVHLAELAEALRSSSEIRSMAHQLSSSAAPQVLHFREWLDQVPPSCRKRYHLVGSQPGQPARSFGAASTPTVLRGLKMPVRR